jgi:SAM-dependent methyltransferase
MEMTLDRLVALVSQRERLRERDAKIWTAFWQSYPRFRFLKTVARDARLLDIGAGSGGLALWAKWLPPKRDDIVFHGVDLGRGEHAGLHRDWRVADLDAGLPDFGAPFDAFHASHLIEHLRSPARLFADMRAQAAPGARVYLEWPHPRTQGFPRAAELAARGFAIQTLNFSDDDTHLATPAWAEVAHLLAEAGFAVVEGGEISLGLLAEEVAVRGRRRDELDWRQMGLWAATGWCNHIVARFEG